ncbi:MAG TPA: hypothetical protein VFS43_23990 [Polyangiaceae bacterium]|nr:hypothetical protein [Polyangiaceae bacterium]
MTTEAPPPPADEAGGGSAPEAEEKRGRGRPSKLTDDVRKKLGAALRRGHPPESACLVAGIGSSSYYAWRKQGEEDRAAGRKTEHTDFLDTCEVELAKFYDKHLRRIDRASAGKGPKAKAGEEVGGYDARLSLAILGRRAPEYFAERRAVELTGKGGGPLQVDLSKASDEELERILAGGDAASAKGGR